MGLENPVRIGWRRGEAGEPVYPIAAFDIRALKVSLETEDEPVPLIVVTKLAATNESSRVRMERCRRQIGERCRIRKRIEIGIAVPPAVTGISTKVEPRPCKITRRSHRRDLLHFFPTVHLCAREGGCAHRRNHKGHPY